MKDQFVDHVNTKAETVAQTVGVNRAEDEYKKPIDPNTIRKFYGCENDATDDVVANEHFKKNMDAFYADDSGILLDKTQG